MNLSHSLPPGFEVPLYRSLTEPILLGGAPVISPATSSRSSRWTRGGASRRTAVP